VLVVDDEPAVRQMTVRTLETFGYRTKVAAGGAEALQLYAAHQGELAAVITDLMMPSMDGHALIRSLVAINPLVRIVAVSGVGPGSKEAGHINPAVNRVLTKPFTAYTLLSVLRQVLREPRSE
jgi:CheY-like chemotaxis protein